MHISETVSNNVKAVIRTVGISDGGKIITKYSRGGRGREKQMAGNKSGKEERKMESQECENTPRSLRRCQPCKRWLAVTVAMIKQSSFCLRTFLT